MRKVLTFSVKRYIIKVQRGWERAPGKLTTKYPLMVITKNKIKKEIKHYGKQKVTCNNGRNYKGY